MLNKILNIFQNNQLPNLKHSDSNVPVKESEELDFWINVWNKKIIEKVIDENNLNSTKSKNFAKFYEKERIKVAQQQLSGILWMAKKPDGYLDEKKVVEIGPGCCCALEVSGAETKIAFEPLSEKYRDNGLLLKNNDSVVYLTIGSEKMPIFSDSIDVVIASNSLDHVENLENSVKEIYRVLKSGGELFLNIEIDHEPTECEPYSLSYKDINKIFSKFKTVFINKTTDEMKRVWVRAVFQK